MVAIYSATVILASLLTSAPALSHGAEYVLHISVDGLKPSDLQIAIDAGNAPNFERFKIEGATTMNARTDYTHTITLPNHTTMLTGRPVSQPTGMPNTTHHGYTSNGEPLAAWTLHNQGNLNVSYKASTFDVAHDAGLSTAHYASKSKFVIFDRSFNSTNGADHPNGRDKIDTFFAEENASAAMQTQLLAELPLNHPNYTFIHYADTDIAGHTYGWGSTQYMNALATVDDYLGELFELVENDAAFSGRTAIVLSADHAGLGTGHSNANNPAIYTIPFFAWGAGVGQGDLYAFNPDSRVNPLTSRPDYTAAGQPIRNGDGGNLALKLLGLGPIPGSLINAAQDLRVTAPGDFNADGSVNAADYVVWRRGVGTLYSIDDYHRWVDRFSEPTTDSRNESPIDARTNPAIPEPGTLVFVLTATAICIFRHPATSRKS